MINNSSAIASVTEQEGVARLVEQAKINEDCEDELRFHRLYPLASPPYADVFESVNAQQADQRGTVIVIIIDYYKRSLFFSSLFFFNSFNQLFQQ